MAIYYLKDTVLEEIKDAIREQLDLDESTEIPTSQIADYILNIGGGISPVGGFLSYEGEEVELAIEPETGELQWDTSNNLVGSVTWEQGAVGSNTTIANSDESSTTRLRTQGYITVSDDGLILLDCDNDTDYAGCIIIWASTTDASARIHSGWNTLPYAIRVYSGESLRVLFKYTTEATITTISNPTLYMSD